MFFGDQMSSALIDQRNHSGEQKYCPDCLRTTGFQSGLFDLVPVRVFPEHACRLTNVCPHCNKKVLWSRSTLFTCMLCDGDLTTAQTEKIPTSDLRGVTAIAKRLKFPHRHPDLAGQNLELADKLSHLTTGEVLELMITLAGYLGKRSIRSSFLHFTPQSKGSLHLALNLSLPFVRRWPEGLFEFLDLYSSMQVHTTRKAYGLRKSFGRFYFFLIEQAQEPWQTVKAAFSDYIENHWTGISVPRGNLGPEQAAPSVRSITVAETCRILGLSPPKVHDHIKCGTGGFNPMERWQGAPILARQDDFEKIASNGQKLCRFGQISRRLGLSRRMCRQFLRADVITAYLGPQIDGLQMYLFFASQADEILADFGKHLTEAAANASQLITFAQVLLYQKLHQVPLKTLIDAVRSGRLHSIGKDDSKSGLNTFLFNRKATIQVLQELEIETAIGRDTNVSVACATAHLRMCPRAISEMIEEGFLEVAPQSAQKKRITIKSIEAFKRGYVKTSVLVKEHRSASCFLVKRLKAIGIETASFYARQSLRGIDFKTLLKRA